MTEAENTAKPNGYKRGSRKEFVNQGIVWRTYIRDGGGSAVLVIAEHSINAVVQRNSRGSITYRATVGGEVIGERYREEYRAITAASKRLIELSRSQPGPAPVPAEPRFTLSTITYRKPAGVIDLTPTWSALLPVMIAAIENGTASGRAIAIDELTRMAQIADEYVALSKKGD